MIRSLRAFFLGRLLREKVLLLGFLALGLGLWGLSFAQRADVFWRAQKRTTQDLKTQEQMLKMGPEIEALTKAAASQMDPAKTLDPTLLAVEVRRLANETGVKFNASNVTPGPKVGQFSINTLKLNITPTDWDAFRKFYARLQERAPYIAVTELVLTPVRGNERQIQASLTVASFEVKG